MKQKQKPRQVPVSKVVARPQDLQSMVVEAGADADFQELLSASNAQAQQDTNKVMFSVAQHNIKSVIKLGTRTQAKLS